MLQCSLREALRYLSRQFNSLMSWGSSICAGTGWSTKFSKLQSTLNDVESPGKPGALRASVETPYSIDYLRDISGEQAVNASTQEPQPGDNMLSGEFHSVPLTSIQWDRSGRIRRDITEAAILEKMESMQRIGLIHPLVITREGVGTSGETRWTAALRLGWDSIAVQYADTLEEDELLSIELEENIKRSDLSWQDECDALLRLHELQLRREPEWTQAQTAERIGLSSASVTNKLAVAKAIRLKDPRVLAVKDYSTAFGIVTRKAERNKADELKSIKIVVEDIDSGEEDQSGVASTSTPAPTSPILNASFLEWVETYSGPAFNLLHCDFPYGIGADKFNQGAADAYGGYEDSPETYWELVDCLINNREKLLGNSGHLIFWFSMRYYTETLARLQEHFWVDPYPLIWHKSDNKGTLPDPTRGPRRIYEVAFLCSLGDRKIIQSVSNVYSGPTERTGEHMSEKSQAMLQHFFRMVVDENTRILDPTAGSGSALRAARALGAGPILGLELNAEYAENARRAWEATA